MNNSAVKIGVIGLGPRAETLLATLRGLPQNECQVTAVCDLNTERIEKICNIFKANSLAVPAAYTDYKKLIADPEVQAVLIPTSWNSHLAIAADGRKLTFYEIYKFACNYVAETGFNAGILLVHDSGRRALSCAAA